MILYKYLSPDRLDVVQRNVIRYTPPGAFNDPFESSPHSAAFAADEEIERMHVNAMHTQGERTWLELPPEAKEELAREKYDQILAMVGPHARRLFADISKRLLPVFRARITAAANERVGVLSLSEKPSSLLMWAHYAAEHAGFVLGLDAEHPAFAAIQPPESSGTSVRRVLYARERPSLPLVEFSPTDLFFTKSDDWKYEEEWRVLKPLADAVEVVEKPPWNIHLFPLPADCIREVVLGCRTIPEVEAHIRSVLAEDRYQGVKLFRAMVDDRHFALNILPATL